MQYGQPFGMDQRYREARLNNRQQEKSRVRRIILERTIYTNHLCLQPVYGGHNLHLDIDPYPSIPYNIDMRSLQSYTFFAGFYRTDHDPPQA